MTLRLYFHPLASFCWKALIALYETGAPFAPHIVDLGDAAQNAAFKAVWPIGKFPVLRDEARDRTIPESTIIIEYLSEHFPGGKHLLPADPSLRLETRLKDRLYDLYVHEPMQKIVTDRIRPPASNDPYGVEHARAQLAMSYAILDREMAGRLWAMGEDFTLADCAAAPALYYANKVASLAAHPGLASYLGRLTERPSFARVLREAEPYFKMFPAASDDTAA
jgi:glutathione S-transferase